MKDKVVTCVIYLLAFRKLTQSCLQASDQADFSAVEMHRAGPDRVSGPTVDHGSSVSRSRTLSHLVLADGNG